MIMWPIISTDLHGIIQIKIHVFVPRIMHLLMVGCGDVLNGFVFVEFYDGMNVAYIGVVF